MHVTVLQQFYGRIWRPDIQDLAANWRSSWSNERPAARSVLYWRVRMTSSMVAVTNTVVSKNTAWVSPMCHVDGIRPWRLVANSAPVHPPWHNGRTTIPQ